MFILFTLALNPLWKNMASQEVSLLLSATLTVMLYLTLLVHEFSHSLVAKKLEIPVHQIILWMFGGAANIEKQPQSPSQEFKITIVGPLASVVIAVLFYGLSLISVKSPILSIFFLTVASLNLIWAIFNLIPAFPMDGGRIFRSLLWYFLKNKIKATRIAVFTGLPLLILAGILLHNWFIIAISLWVFMAGRSELKLVILQEKLSQIKIRKIMTPIDPYDFDPRSSTFPEAICSPEDNAWTVLEKMTQIKTDHFKVIENNQVVGLITLSLIADYTD
jgi:Zn-dependent protease